jgi:hypothetical protein
MKFLKFFKISIILLIFISCKNKSSDSFSTGSEYQTETNNVENVGNSKPKYVFAVFTVEEPDLIIEKEEYYSDDPYDLNLKYKDKYDVILNKVSYKTEIQEIYGYNEDIKYKILDDFEIEVNDKIILKSSVYRDNLWIKCKDDGLRDLFKNYEFKIIDRQVQLFDSYSEASKSRQTY